jgi:hypothetical protein
VFALAETAPGQARGFPAFLDGYSTDCGSYQSGFLDFSVFAL